MNERTAFLTGMAMITVATSHAPVMNLSGNLSDLHRVPPNASPASAWLTGSLDDVSRAIALTGAYTGMLGPVTAAHIHRPAPAGNGRWVIVPITPTGGTSGTQTQNAILSATNVSHVLPGKTYVNVHSTVLPGGDSRDQIRAEPVPNRLLSPHWGVEVLAAMRRRKK